MLPSLFVSHGAPTLPLTDAPAKRFLETLGTGLAERPTAILVVSAHWETSRPAVNSVLVNDTIHDFSGFPPELYHLTYPAPGSASLAETIAQRLGSAGLACGIDHHRGLDHGAWVPLMLMFPLHDIPVLQLSVQTYLGPAHHLALGAALAGLRQEGVLVIASGSFTHDLSSIRFSSGTAAAAEPDWVTEFATWMDTALTEGRIDDLLAYRRLAPYAERNHPTDEHLLPLYVALGAAGHDPRITRLHHSVTFGVLRMDAYAFDSSASMARSPSR